MSYVRRSARVLLVDGQERVLLFRFFRDHRAPENGQIWITPGGGVDRGEKIHYAAARELWEETGLRVPADDLLPLVAYSSGYADLGWKKGMFRDDYFLHRVDSHEVDESGQEPWERGVMTNWHWWTLDELRATEEEIVPRRLADLVTDLLRDGPLDEPQVLMWHH